MIIASVLAVAYLAQAAAMAPAADFLITETSVGRIRIGNTAADVHRRYRGHPTVVVKDGAITQEGDPYQVLQLYEDGERLVTAVLEDDVVDEIWVESDRFATKRKIRVGSTFADVVRRYGKPMVLRGGGTAAYVMGHGALMFHLRTELHTDRDPPRDSEVEGITVLRAGRLKPSDRP